MRQYEVPSGGDWSIHRGGAVYLTNTRHVTVTRCRFTQLGGNAVVLSNWNRRAVVSANEFAWLGESAVVLLGSVAGMDGASAPLTPVDTRVDGNVIHELGVYVKQTAGVVQFLSQRSTLSRNVIFNCPRAGININDGYAGGLNISHNLIFNAVRETGDHGPINTWDVTPSALTRAIRAPHARPGISGDRPRASVVSVSACVPVVRAAHPVLGLSQ